jgi:hypothetical protein
VTAANTAPRRGGPPLWFAALGGGGIVVGLLLVLAQVLGLGVGGGGQGGAVTIAPAGDAAQRTSDVVAAALSAAAFVVQEPQTPYRPGESQALVGVPRRVLQVVVPSDPTHGYVVIYELPSNNDADRVGQDFDAYLRGGTGAIQYPRDAQFVIRRVGQTLVFFPWSPSVSPDPEVARLASVLAGIGNPVGAS